jgi:hypothetical protein
MGNQSFIVANHSLMKKSECLRAKSPWPTYEIIDSISAHNNITVKPSVTHFEIKVMALSFHEHFQRLIHHLAWREGLTREKTQRYDDFR